MAGIKETHALAIEMLTQHGLSDWKIRWNRKVGEAGRTFHGTKTIELSSRAVESFSDADVLALIKHEISHALVGPGHGHDKTWAHTMKSIGGIPDENCPTFSTEKEKFVASFSEPDNMLYIVLVNIAAWIATPFGIFVSLATLGFYGCQILKNSRPPLPEAVRIQIEKDVLS